MTTDRHRIEVAGIDVEIVRKSIKNLHVGVYPPGGRVRVAAPLHLDDVAIRLAVVSRLPWIRRNQKAFADQARQSQREMVAGETLFYQGQRYRLKVSESCGPPGVHISGRGIVELRASRGAGRDQREAILQRWYRAQLRALVPQLIAKWEPKVGRTVGDLRIKRMKTRWGSCNPEVRRIWLNLELIKKHPRCLEYVLVHEMVHLHVRKHDERFREWMDRLMPNWRTHRDELSRAPLAHEEWAY